MTLLPSTSTFPFPGSSSLYGCKGFPLRSRPRCLIRSHESPQALKEHPFPYLKKPSRKHLSTPPFTTPLVKPGSHVQTSTNQSCDNWKGTIALPTKKGRIFTEGVPVWCKSNIYAQDGIIAMWYYLLFKNQFRTQFFCAASWYKPKWVHS